MHIPNMIFYNHRRVCIFLFDIIAFLAKYCFAFILHVCKSGSFPKPLSKREEDEYLRRVKLGDMEARNKLVEHNLRLVAHIIKKYYAVSSDQDDLVSIGTIGLIKAINTFDSDKNIKLSSYASRCIENEILMHFRNGRKSSQNVSLSDTIETDKDGNPLTLMDVLTDENDFTWDVEVRLNSEKLKTYLETELTERERQVIIMRYGLDGRDPLTQREVAQKMKISRSYISRIEKKALENLRRKFSKP